MFATRRWFWIRFACLSVFLQAAARGIAEEVVLPTGNSPAPIVSGYFPDRLHEFVWRNWNVVEPAKLAKVLGTSVENVAAVAESMGLPAAAPIPPEMKSRGYITVIRRNWHLLPYEQLLELVEMTPEELLKTLWEDDFLLCKLGFVKPKCERLQYAAPDDATRRRAAEIKQIVAEEFGEEMMQPAEPRFKFLEKFTGPDVSANETSEIAKTKAGDEQIRFIYSYFAVYGDPLLNPKLDPYPDGLLQKYSALGINGVWLHVVLRDLAPGGDAFPEFGAGCEQRLANLRALVERAKKHGIGIYLYMNEPRAMPETFFKNSKVPGRAEMAGTSSGGLTALCTAHPAVRKWMSDSLAHVFQSVPDLAGVFTITASENLTNCASHAGWTKCPRCKGREYAEIIADANAIIAEGVHRGNPRANVIAWDWGWHNHGESPDIIVKLPKSVRLMSVSEWAAPFERGGVKGKVGEYSISVVGPGPRAAKQWASAKQAGLKTMAKMQLNVTWEISTVPYLPVMDLVAEHCHRLASAGVDGMLLSWSLGGYPSPNLEIAARLQARPTPSVDEVLNAEAVKMYGAEGAPLARKAWTAFSRAYQEYPYNQSVIYNCPVQVGPANPLYAKKTGYRPTMTGIPYDDHAEWRGPYPAETFASQFEKTAAGWREGIPLLKEAVEKAPAEKQDDAKAELRFAEAAGLHFQSVANQTRFVMARDALAKSPESIAPEEKQRLRAEIVRCLKSELALARREFSLTREDSRIGFEAANQYFFLPADLAEKVVNCRWLLEQFGDKQEQKSLPR